MRGSTARCERARPVRKPPITRGCAAALRDVAHRRAAEAQREVAESRRRRPRRRPACSRSRRTARSGGSADGAGHRPAEPRRWAGTTRASASAPAAAGRTRPPNSKWPDAHRRVEPRGGELDRRRLPRVVGGRSSRPRSGRRCATVPGRGRTSPETRRSSSAPPNVEPCTTSAASGRRSSPVGCTSPPRRSAARRGTARRSAGWAGRRRTRRPRSPPPSGALHARAVERAERARRVAHAADARVPAARCRSSRGPRGARRSAAPRRPRASSGPRRPSAAARRRSRTRAGAANGSAWMRASSSAHADALPALAERDQPARRERQTHVVAPVALGVAERDELRRLRARRRRLLGPRVLPRRERLAAAAARPASPPPR